jgi:hypothetical protein
MADTPRTITELQALFLDNIVGDISPQDLRDFLVSAAPGHGSFSRLVAAPTTIATPGDYVKAAGTTVLGLGAAGFDMPQDGRLRFIGVSPRHLHVAVTVSMTSSGPNNVIGLKIAKNGVLLDDSVALRFLGTGSDIGSTALHADISGVENDYLELFVTNETDTDSVTIEELYFYTMGMLE